MNKLLSWAVGNTMAATVGQKNDEAGEKCLDKEAKHLTNYELSVHSKHEVDPKVAEFFQDLPEPYRQKAIQRYSSREGFYRWDIFRNIDMESERSLALKGVYLEDKREAVELSRQSKELERTSERERLKQLFHERTIPEWEQKFLKVIPLQPGDSMTLKLFQSISLAICGALLLTAGVRDKRNKSFTKFRANVGLYCGATLFFCFNMTAAARLMDLDFFDRTEDDRFWNERLQDALREKFRPVIDAWHEASWR